MSKTMLLNINYMNLFFLCRSEHERLLELVFGLSLLGYCRNMTVQHDNTVSEESKVMNIIFTFCP